MNTYGIQTVIYPKGCEARVEGTTLRIYVPDGYPSPARPGPIQRLRAWWARVSK